MNKNCNLEFTNILLNNINFGKKSSLDKVKKILILENINYNRFNVIHITGTAGKGSTSKMIATGLKNKQNL